MKVKVFAYLFRCGADNQLVYNFWEPLHFARHGYGFQTWELSPKYAIRSWAYILLHYGPLIAISALLSLEKVGNVV